MRRPGLMRCIAGASLVLGSCSSSDPGREDVEGTLGEDCDLPGVVVGGIGTDPLNARLARLAPCDPEALAELDIQRVSGIDGVDRTIVLVHAPTRTDELAIWDAKGMRPGPLSGRVFGPAIARAGDRYAVHAPADGAGDSLIVFGLSSSAEEARLVDQGDIDATTWIDDAHVAFVVQSGVTGPSSLRIWNPATTAPDGVTAVSLTGVIEQVGNITSNGTRHVALSSPVTGALETVVVEVNGSYDDVEELVRIAGWAALTWSPDGTHLLLAAEDGRLGTLRSSGLTDDIETIRGPSSDRVFSAAWIDGVPDE